MSRPEEEFEDLQKLIGCKRYEQPPPGYFVSFADKVIARIETPQAVEYSSWWSWLLDRFDAKPILVCAYGLAVSSLLFTGLWLSQAFKADAATPQYLSGPWLAATPVSPALLSPMTSEGEFMGTTLISTSPRSRLVFREDPGHVVFPANSLRLQPVGYTQDVQY